METATETTRTQSGYTSHALAAWANELTFDALSRDAIKAAKLLLFDSLGCAVAGSVHPDVLIALDHHRQMGGTPSCNTFVHGFRTNPVDAAFLNALMIRALDFNDVYWKADPVHPSDLIPAPLAICDMRGLDGRELIVGIVIAYEMLMRLAETGVPGIHTSGWHHATLTAIAAPIAAGRMLGLTAEQIQHAIGISAAHSICTDAVITGRMSTMKITVDPMATRSGVEAVLLAKRGSSGPAHVLDGAGGLAACIEAAGGRLELGRLTGDLPRSDTDHYRIVDCGMKSFPVRALLHAPLTALLRLVEAHSIAADDVASIRVEVMPRVKTALTDADPLTRDSADRNLSYVLAVGLVDGTVTPAQLTPERIDDPALADVMHKVEVMPNPEFDEHFPQYQPSLVTVTLNDGTAHEQRVDVPKGDPRDPLTEADIMAKFTALGESVIGATQCAAARQLIMSIDTEDDMARLFRTLEKE